MLSLQVVGEGTYPRSNRVSLTDLWTGTNEYDRVTVRARVLKSKIDREFTVLTLANASTTVAAPAEAFADKFAARFA